MPSDETRYTNKVFMAGALPLMKTIANDVPELKKKFEGVDAIYQVSAKVNVRIKRQSISLLKTANGQLNWANISVKRELMPSLLFPRWKK